MLKHLCRDKMEQKRKIQSKTRYLAALLIGTFVFILVFFITLGISYLEFQRFSNLQFDTSYKIFENKLDYTFFEQEVCSEELPLEFTNNLAFQGGLIDELERKLGKRDSSVIERKKFYTLVEVEHLEFIRIMKEKCNRNIKTILFFYSNEPDYIDRSEEVGKTLNAILSQDDNLIVYSFDTNLDSTLIKKLKEKYSVEEPITIIINEKSILKDDLSYLTIKNSLEE